LFVCNFTYFFYSVIVCNLYLAEMYIWEKLEREMRINLSNLKKKKIFLRETRERSFPSFYQLFYFTCFISLSCFFSLRAYNFQESPLNKMIQQVTSCRTTPSRRFDYFKSQCFMIFLKVSLFVLFSNNVLQIILYLIIWKIYCAIGGYVSF